MNSVIIGARDTQGRMSQNSVQTFKSGTRAGVLWKTLDGDWTWRTSSGNSAGSSNNIGIARALLSGLSSAV